MNLTANWSLMWLRKNCKRLCKYLAHFRALPLGVCILQSGKCDLFLTLLDTCNHCRTDLKCAQSFCLLLLLFFFSVCSQCLQCNDNSVYKDSAGNHGCCIYHFGLDVFCGESNYRLEPLYWMNGATKFGWPYYRGDRVLSKRKRPSKPNKVSVLTGWPWGDGGSTASTMIPFRHVKSISICNKVIVVTKCHWCFTPKEAMKIVL